MIDVVPDDHCWAAFDDRGRYDISKQWSTFWGPNLEGIITNSIGDVLFHLRVEWTGNYGTNKVTMRGQQTDDGGRYPKVGENASRRHRSRPVFKRFSVLFGEMQFSASTQECDRCQRINVTRCQWWRYFSAEIGPAATKTFHTANLQFVAFCTAVRHKCQITQLVGCHFSNHRTPSLHFVYT